MAAPRMATMALSGLAAVSSLERDLGTTGRIISTATSIIISIIERVTVGRCPRAARAQRRTVGSFTARQCMIHVATKRRADTDK